MFSLTLNTMIMTTRPYNCRDALITLKGIDLQTMTKCCIVLVILSAFNVLFVAALNHSIPLKLNRLTLTIITIGRAQAIP